MSKQQIHKSKESNNKGAAPAGPPPIPNPSSPTGNDGTTMNANPVSPVKFFLLWFGLPMAFIAVIAWAMAHS